jgi:hypothetical protein
MEDGGICGQRWAIKTMMMEVLCVSKKGEKEDDEE